jgi:hypothetical protein
MDPVRRKLLKTGAAVTAMATAPGVFARHTSKGGAMPFYERGPVRIHYEEAGSGFPLLLIPGGGLNSTIAALANPFNIRSRSIGRGSPKIAEDLVRVAFKPWRLGLPLR